MVTRGAGLSETQHRGDACVPPWRCHPARGGPRERLNRELLHQQHLALSPESRLARSCRLNDGLQTLGPSLTGPLPYSRSDCARNPPSAPQRPRCVQTDRVNPQGYFSLKTALSLDASATSNGLVGVHSC